jgi:hypothetical protein
MNYVNIIKFFFKFKIYYFLDEINESQVYTTNTQNVNHPGISIRGNKYIKKEKSNCKC